MNPTLSRHIFVSRSSVASASNAQQDVTPPFDGAIARDLTNPTPQSGGQSLAAGLLSGA